MLLQWTVLLFGLLATLALSATHNGQYEEQTSVTELHVLQDYRFANVIKRYTRDKPPEHYDSFPYQAGPRIPHGHGGPLQKRTPSDRRPPSETVLPAVRGPLESDESRGRYEPPDQQRLPYLHTRRSPVEYGPPGGERPPEYHKPTGGYGPPGGYEPPPRLAPPPGNGPPPGHGTPPGRGLPPDHGPFKEPGSPGSHRPPEDHNLHQPPVDHRAPTGHKPPDKLGPPSGHRTPSDYEGHYPSEMPNPQDSTPSTQNDENAQLIKNLKLILSENNIKNNGGSQSDTKEKLKSGQPLSSVEANTGLSIASTPSHLKGFQVAPVTPEN